MYRILNIQTNEIVPCYFQCGGDEYDFNSIESARKSNCHGMFEDKTKYRIVKFKVTEELVDINCDPITPDEQIKINNEIILSDKIEERYNELLKNYKTNDKNEFKIMTEKSNIKLQALIEIMMSEAVE